jgi:PncC family amidohydrolase
MKVQIVSPQISQHHVTQNLGFEVLKTIDLVRDKGFTLGFAESCTGGLLSSEFAKVSGVSDIFMGSVVCYSNDVKQNILGVKSDTLKKFGAVSGECAEELVLGVLKNLKTSLAISITGIAGPKGGSTLKPVGTVFVSVGGMDLANAKIVIKNYCHSFGEISREDIQKAASTSALEHLQKLIIEMKDL